MLKSTSVGPIVGGIVDSIALIIRVVVIIYFLLKSLQCQPQSQFKYGNQNPPRTGSEDTYEKDDSYYDDRKYTQETPVGG